MGGLPAERMWPFEFKAVFSPIDVIEEYTRPARFKRTGQMVTLPALTEVEPVDFPGVGTLEAFNTDGLRTLLRLDVPSMVEKTLRYPGHADRMRMLRETGFFGTEPLEAGGARMRPLDLTAKLLFSSWQLGAGEEDFTVMRIAIEGEKDGRRARHTWDLLDRYDRETGTTSMARTTGYTAPPPSAWSPPASTIARGSPRPSTWAATPTPMALFCATSPSGEWCSRRR